MGEIQAHINIFIFINLPKLKNCFLNTDLSGKLSPSDVINSLTSTDTQKPLSAAQGRALANGSANDSTAREKVKFTGISSSAHTVQSFSYDYEDIQVSNLAGYKLVSAIPAGLSNATYTDKITLTVSIRADNLISVLIYNRYGQTLSFHINFLLLWVKA